MPSTFLKSLLLCSLATLIATIAAFSQEINAPVGGEVAAMILPADNIELVSVDGRATTVTVLSMAADKQSIVIRTVDGKEMPLLLSNLNAATVEKLVGKKSEKGSYILAPSKPTRISPEDQKLPEKELFKKFLSIRMERAKEIAESVPRNENEAKIQKLASDVLPFDIQSMEAAIASDKSRTERQSEWRVAGEKLDAKDAQKRILSLDAKDEIHLWIPLVKESIALKTRSLTKDPTWDQYNLTPLDILPKIEIKNKMEDEEVSLRGQCEKLGVKPAQQIGETCALYSAQHLLQFACLSVGKKPPSVGMIEETARKHAGMIGNWEAIPKLTGSRPITQWIGNPTGAEPFMIGMLMSHEIAKHEIRNGRPVLADVGGHQVVLVGFSCKKGVTHWQFLNSNRIDVNGGYVDKCQASHVMPIHSIRFE